MTGPFKIIGITLPDLFEDEGAQIALLLESGAVDRMHIRKPGAAEEDVCRLIKSIPAGLHARLSLHSHHGLAVQFGCGVHLNAANPLPPPGFDGTFSRSCHGLDQLGHDVAYSFLSPVFDSISKPGYASRFSPDNLAGKVDSRTIALGGVTPDKFAALARAGFGGAALLGYLWHDTPQKTAADILFYRKKCNIRCCSS